MSEPSLAGNRYLLKDSIRKNLDFARTEQAQGLPPPPMEKPFPAQARRIDLPPAAGLRHLGAITLSTAIAERRSRRRFLPAPLALDELAFLFWCTQGLRRRLGPDAALRTVPSAGARHAFETHCCAYRVTGLDPAWYRYLPLEHQLLLEQEVPTPPAVLAEACLGQDFVGQAAAVLVWSAIPRRMEWRYGLAAHRVILIDAGHVCQNLYLACEAINCGTCAVAAYDQERMDGILGLDGDEEFVIYLAPVGKA